MPTSSHDHQADVKMRWERQERKEMVRDRLGESCVTKLCVKELRVCVCTICIDVKLQYIAGGQQPIFLCCPTKLRKMWWMGSWTHEPVPALYIYVYIYVYIYIVPPLGAYKPQLGGTYILSLLFYTVNVYCDYTSIYQ